VTYPGQGLVQLTVPAAAPGTIPAPQLHLPDAGVQSVSVSINGRDVTSAVLARRLRNRAGDVGLSAAEYLHPGKNTAAITVVMTDGRAQTVQRSFALDGRRAIPARRHAVYSDRPEHSSVRRLGPPAIPNAQAAATT
jgi:hypothetical protein